MNDQTNPPFLNANAICFECGSAKEDSKTGYCINDHDNWIELDDPIERIKEATKKFNISIEKLEASIKNNIDIPIKKLGGTSNE